MAITGGGSPRCNTCTLPDYWWLPGKCHCVQLPTPPILVPLCASSESVLDPDSSTVTLSVEDFIIALCKALSQTQPQGNFPPPPHRCFDLKDIRILCSYRCSPSRCADSITHLQKEHESSCMTMMLLSTVCQRQLCWRCEQRRGQKRAYCWATFQCVDLEEKIGFYCLAP